MKDAKNTVQKGFRCDTETAQELDEWLGRHNLKNSQALAAIVEILKLAEDREAIPGRSSELDNFQNLLGQLSVAYRASVQYGSNAEQRARTELLTRIEANEAGLKAMKNEMKVLEEDRDKAREELADTRSKLEEAQQVIAARDTMLKQKEDALKDKTDLVEQFKEERVRNVALINEAAELKAQFSDLEKQVIILERENLQFKQNAVRSDVQKLILDYHQDSTLTEAFWQQNRK